MFEKFFPKEFNFYDFLDKEADMVVQAGALFKDIAAAGDVNEANREKMRDIEHQGDKMAYAIIDHLNKTFITPFDREDIHTLAKKLDDVNDTINTIVSRMKVYKITKVSPDLVEFALLIEQSVKALACAIKGLRDMKNLTNTLKLCMDIGKLESAGDKLRDKALGELFEKQKDPIEIIKWKELYQEAETVLDICKVVAHVVESILVKQA
jgi:uncharacterized protein